MGSSVTHLTPYTLECGLCWSTFTLQFSYTNQDIFVEQIHWKILHTLNNQIMESSSTVSILGTITTVRVATSRLLRQLAIYLTILADLLDIESMEIKTIMVDSIINEQEKECLEMNGMDDITETKTSEDEIVEESSRSRKDTLLSTDSGLEPDIISELDLSDFAPSRDEETGLDLITLDEVSYHNSVDDAWIVVYDKIYEMTEYLESSRHPGGEDVIQEYLGYDATLAFRGVNHSKSALRVLDKYCIGILPSYERLNFSSE